MTQAELAQRAGVQRAAVTAIEDGRTKKPNEQVLAILAQSAGISVDDLLNPNAAVAAPVRCDAVAWSLFGLSMAGWNMAISLGLAGLWAMAARRA